MIKNLRKKFTLVAMGSMFLVLATIMGYYYPTAKNAMVKDFYQIMGFEKMEETDTGVTIWKFEIPADYEKKNIVIAVNADMEK